MIAFIGAMDEEVNALLSLMENVQTSTINDVDFHVGTLSGKECVVMKSGVAKVAAAITTTILLENFEVDGVVNIGTAGGLDEREEVLDVVISDRVAHHDVEVEAFNWPKGFDQDKTCYQADSHYIEVMKQIMEEEKDRVWIGNIASGDQFVCKPEQVEKILRNYPGAMCAEMESAAVAQTCRHFHKPFIIIRSLSDITLRKNNEISFDEYVEKASARSAIWCKKFMERV